MNMTQDVFDLLSSNAIPMINRDTIHLRIISI